MKRLFIAAIATLGAAVLIPSSATDAGIPAIFVDTTTAPDGSCVDGDCALADAIESAGEGFAVAFDIPTTDPGYDPAEQIWTIDLTANLPPITEDSILIDGYSQTGASVNTNSPGQPSNAVIKIEINGSAIPAASIGFRVLGDEVKIGGLAIGNFTTGIFVELGNDAEIYGNFIGTDARGLAARPNARGIVISDDGSSLVGGNNAVDVNLISGNTLAGIHLLNGAHSIKGNIIGLDKTGASLANATGVKVESLATNTTIGGDTAAQRNVISRSTVAGIEILTDNNAVHGNYIGTSIDGNSPRANAIGVRITGDGNQVGGAAAGQRNIISGNTVGVQIRGSANTVAGNYMGANAAGNSDLSNENAIEVGFHLLQSPVEDNIIGGTTAGARNVIIASADYAIHIDGASTTGTLVAGNYIGVGPNGTSLFGNDDYGVLISGSPGNTIGGLTAGHRNIIAANENDELVRIEGPGAVGNKVQGNYIGLLATGFPAPGFASAGLSGVDVDGAPNTLIGGDSAEAANVIVGDVGVIVRGAGAAGTAIQRNYIGTDATGEDSAAPPGATGIALNGGATGVTIGGTGGARWNVISGNNEGIAIHVANNNVVHGNYIGTAEGGAVLVPNLIAGIVLYNGAEGNQIGGTAPGTGNIISRNGTGIMAFEGATGNSFGRNFIYRNGNLGIDLATDGNIPDGVTLNDPGDADTGGNNAQNYPELVAATGGLLSIQGQFGSAPNAQYRLEFFLSEQCSLSGYGEGEQSIGSVNVTTDADGLIPFTLNSSTEVDPELSETFVTATATSLVTGDTSEFSNCVEVQPAPSATASPTPTAGATITSTPTNTPESTPPLTTTPGQTVTPIPTATAPVSGDADCDGFVNEEDVVTILANHAGIGSLCDNRADVDCDGDVDIDDALRILLFIAGVSLPQPSGCPEIGTPK